MVSQIAQDSFRYAFVLSVMRRVLSVFPQLNRQEQERALEHIYNNFGYFHYSSEDAAALEVCEAIRDGNLLNNANTVIE